MLLAHARSASLKRYYRFKDKWTVLSGWEAVQHCKLEGRHDWEGRSGNLLGVSRDIDGGYPPLQVASTRQGKYARVVLLPTNSSITTTTTTTTTILTYPRSR